MSVTTPIASSAGGDTAGREASSAASERRRDVGLRRQALAIRWATVLGLLGVWEGVCELWASHSSYFAAPSAIIGSGFPYLVQGSTLTEIATTAQRFLVAFAISAIAGIAIGIVLGRARHFYLPARNILYVFYTLPLVPFYPLLTLWLGIGFRSETAFGVLHGIWPVIFGTMAAVRQVDPPLVDAARSLGAGRLTRARKVMLPAIEPDVVGALRLAASLSLIGVLIAEILISVQGIGGQINQLVGTLQPARLDAVIVVIWLAAVVINTTVGLVERRVSRWRGPMSAG